MESYIKMIQRSKIAHAPDFILDLDSTRKVMARYELIFLKNFSLMKISLACPYEDFLRKIT